MDFTQTLKDAGLPTTQDELEVIWKNTVTSTGSLISNTDKMSPFWRVVTALITNPVLWLINFIAVTLIPNAYVKYSAGEFLDLLADAVNLTRKQPTKATGIVRFNRVDLGLAITVPIGTVIQTASINGFIYKLITTDTKIFPAGLLTLDVPVQAELSGSIFNFGANYYSILPEQIAGITAVANPSDWLMLPGSDIEADDYLRGRIRNQFGTASDYHTDSVYKAMISSFPAVHIDAIWFEHNAPRGPGTANAFVLFDFSASVAQLLANINIYITDQGNHGHGDDLIVYQMPEQSKTLIATVYVEKFLSVAQKADIHDKIVLFINAAFRENALYTPTLTLPYNRFSFSRLGEELHLFIPQIHSISFSLPDIVTGKWIPRLTSLTVNLIDTE